MPFAETDPTVATGIPAVLIVAGLVIGVASIWFFRRDRAETGSKWLATSLAVTSLGVLLNAVL